MLVSSKPGPTAPRKRPPNPSAGPEDAIGTIRSSRAERKPTSTPALIERPSGAVATARVAVNKATTATAAPLDRTTRAIAGDVISNIVTKPPSTSIGRTRADRADHNRQAPLDVASTLSGCGPKVGSGRPLSEFSRQ